MGVLGDLRSDAERRTQAEPKRLAYLQRRVGWVRVADEEDVAWSAHASPMKQSHRAQTVTPLVRNKSLVRSLTPAFAP